VYCPLFLISYLLLDLHNFSAFPNAYVTFPGRR